VTKSVAIIGAGIVGICTAIELLKSGHKVTLFDKEAPGSQASLWNAGVLATSSLIPLNNPTLIRRIPSLLTGRLAGFRFNRRKLVQTFPWAVQFLINSSKKRFNEVADALNVLIKLSHKTHMTYVTDLGQPDLLLENGWLFVYRTKAGFAASAFQSSILDRYNIAHQVLNSNQLAELEPGISGKIHSARYIKDSAVAQPALLLKAYIEYLRALGGEIRRAEISSILQVNGGIVLSSPGTAGEYFDDVVVAAGAWSNQILRTVGIKLPMVVERGYLKTYTLGGATILYRPLFDVEGGYVVSPRPCGIQISTGTELTTINANPDGSQLIHAVGQLKTLLPLGEPMMDNYAVSNRPSLNDSLPAIGPINRIPGLWIATGHQHTGFSTSAGTGRLLSAQINGESPEIDPEPYLPARFSI